MCSLWGISRVKNPLESLFKHETILDLYIIRTFSVKEKIIISSRKDKDITLCHHVTHSHNWCLADDFGHNNWFITAALLLLAILAQACVSWPIRGLHCFSFSFMAASEDCLGFRLTHVDCHVEWCLEWNIFSLLMLLNKSVRFCFCLTFALHTLFQRCSMQPSLEMSPPSSSRCTPTQTATMRCSTTCATSSNSIRFPKVLARGSWTSSCPPGPCRRASTRIRYHYGSETNVCQHIDTLHSNVSDMLSRRTD